MRNKREASVLIPYYIKSSEIFVYLQKRGKEARVLPDYFSFFGGKLEKGESPEEALKREIKEELNIEISGYSFLGEYESSVDVSIVLHMYAMEVTADFENTVTVSEGEYGKFFSKEEVLQEQKLIDSDKKIIKDLWTKIG